MSYHRHVQRREEQVCSELYSGGPANCQSFLDSLFFLRHLQRSFCPKREEKLKQSKKRKQGRRMATEGEKSVMVVGIDESEHSTYALQWTLQHFFSGPNSSAFRLVVVHSKPSPASAVGLAGAGAIDVMPYVDSDLRQIASRVLENAKELCQSLSVTDAHFEVVEGDARNVLCEAVDNHHADMLVVGSHGYGTFKRAVLGSVSDYCAHHAHCSVMIVKKPKHKH